MPTLTDRAIRALKPGPKPYKVTDEKGLTLLVEPSGARLWRLRYRFEGRESMLSLGTYPDTGLALAREKREEARRLLAAGINPSAARKAEKVARADSFEAIALEWIAKETPGWAPAHAKRVKARLERDAFPYIGSMPVGSVTSGAVLDVVRRVADADHVETAHRLLWCIGQTMRFAVATGRALSDPTPALRGALPTAKREHFAAIIEPDGIGELLRAMEAFQGTPATKAALLLAPRLFVRPKELRMMEWAELDLDAKDGALWTIPGAKMKGGRDHLVPLSTQAEAILRELAPLTRRSQYVFPNARSAQRPMSEVAVLAALRRLGYAQGTVTGHGFRATARTLLDEVLGERVEWIEHQLAHSVKDPLGRAYNRTSHLAERRAMMQRWSDYLDGLRDKTAKVVPIRKRGA